MFAVTKYGGVTNYVDGDWMYTRPMVEIPKIKVLDGIRYVLYDFRSSHVISCENCVEYECVPGITV